MERAGGYQTSLDRAGLAIGLGGLIGGTIAVALTIAGGVSGPLGMLAAFLLGILFSALAITAVATPIWVVMHAAGRRGPWHAALIGGATGFALVLFSQTYGFGMIDAPPTDLRTMMFRWASAAALGLLLAAIAALTGYAMWCVAYRRDD